MFILINENKAYAHGKRNLIQYNLMKNTLQELEMPMEVPNTGDMNCSKLASVDLGSGSTQGSAKMMDDAQMITKYYNEDWKDHWRCLKLGT